MIGFSVELDVGGWGRLLGVIDEWGNVVFFYSSVVEIILLGLRDYRVYIKNIGLVYSLGIYIFIWVS